MSASDLSFFHHRGHYGTLNENPKSKESLTLFQLGSLDSSDSIHSRDTGSEWVGAALNLTNSTVGAGCIGLGGAIAHSGGLVSLLALTVFAVLSKYSLDLVVNLSLESQDVRASYESLGFLTYGPRGEFAIILSKGLYSFGCLVAYIVIIKDNLAHAILHLSHLDNADNLMGTWLGLLTNQYFVTVFLCTTIMLPLCMLRNVSPLERFSAFKILVVMLIVVIIIYLFLASEKQQPSFVDHWLVIHPGIFESLGTFVFTFVAQHSIHLVYQSLKGSQHKKFPQATTLGTILSTIISMLMGFVVYVTFWEKTSSSMFELYPSTNAVDVCRILLCISMLLTYPFPFLTVRELFVLLFFAQKGNNTGLTAIEGTQPLVEAASTIPYGRSSLLLPGNDRQLKRKYHVALTIFIWFITLVLALGASSLGAVLNLTGCATGTVISYILPALFSYKLRGHTVLGSLLFVLGGSVGLVGTYYSIVALV